MWARLVGVEVTVNRRSADDAVAEEMVRVEKGYPKGAIEERVALVEDCRREEVEGRVA